MIGGACAVKGGVGARLGGFSGFEVLGVAVILARVVACLVICACFMPELVGRLGDEEM